MCYINTHSIFIDFSTRITTASFMVSSVTYYLELHKAIACGKNVSFYKLKSFMLYVVHTTYYTKSVS